MVRLPVSVISAWYSIEHVTNRIPVTFQYCNTVSFYHYVFAALPEISSNLNCDTSILRRHGESSLLYKCLPPWQHSSNAAWLYLVTHWYFAWEN
uniref:Uncharacterized protein n=1 Tax=Anguilla anguilla TaxID=7936 RepID=A0A0E9XBT0_ANGAN